VKEFVDAARAEGLRFGFYYSLMDWHHPDGARGATDEAARHRFVDYIRNLRPRWRQLSAEQLSSALW
jgi:alpha-L-fucosidase